jgi:hypothetical protein
VSYGPQSPGSASAEPELPAPSAEAPAPETPSSEAVSPPGDEDLCISCLHAETCMIAISRELVRAASGDPPEAIRLDRCSHYLPPPDGFVES